MKDILEGTRKKLGPTPRDIRRFPTLIYPSWLESTDKLWNGRQVSRHLFSIGFVRNSVVTMNNDVLSKPGEWPAAAFVVHAAPESCELDDLADLERVGREVAQLRSTENQNKAVAALAEKLRSGSWRAQSQPLPQSIARVRPVFLSSVIIYPTEMPLRYLAYDTVPILCHPEIPHVVALPLEFWGEDYRENWTDGSVVLPQI